MPTAILRAVATADTRVAETRLAMLGKRIDTIGSAGGKQLSKFGVAARLGFAAAGVAALAFAADSLKAYKEQQVVLTQLQAAIKRSPALLGATTEEFQKQATALQKLTGVQDEEILAVDTILSRFSLTATQLHEVTPLVLDYARATGKDATDAAGMIGRALLGNARALKLVGINFKATGDTAKDATRIMELLRLKVGGTAEAFGRTAAGKVAILKAEFNDFQEVVGKLVSQGLVPVLSVLNKVLGFVNALPGPVKSVTVVTIGLAGAFVGLGLALRVLRASLGGYGVQLGATTAATEGATVATGGLAVAIRGLVFGPVGLVVAVASLGALAAAHVTASGNAKSHAIAVAQFSRQLSSGRKSVQDLSASIEAMPVPEFAKQALRDALRDAAAATGAAGRAAVRATPGIAGFSGQFDGLAGHVRSAADVLWLFAQRAAAARHAASLFGAAQFGRQHENRQAGGPIMPWQAYTVGERGRELFVSDRPGWIVPHAQTESITRGGGGLTVTVNNYAPIGSFDKEVAQSLVREALKTAGL